MLFLQDPFVGLDATSKQGAMNLTFPVSQGEIQDFDDMERIWHYAYSELQELTTNQPLLITSSLWQSECDKAKIAEILFESLNVPSLALACPEMLSLFASGRGTGVVIHSGFDSTTVVPIFHGQILKENCLRVPWGGNLLNQYLALLLEPAGYNFSSLEIATAMEEMKKKTGFVVSEFKDDLPLCEDSKPQIELRYELPDGSMIQLGRERYACTEPCFQPTLFSKIVKNPPNFGNNIESSFGIPQLLHQSVTRCDPVQHQELFSNVILDGGNTMFTGMEARIHAEMGKLLPSSFSVTPIAPPDRTLSTWIGGSIVASSTGFSDHLVTKEQYDEGHNDIGAFLDKSSLNWV